MRQAEAHPEEGHQVVDHRSEEEARPEEGQLVDHPAEDRPQAAPFPEEVRLAEADHY